MKRSELLRELSALGFKLVKQGSKHLLYSDGEVNVVVSYGSKISLHTERSVMMILRRKRQKIEAQNPELN